MTARARTVAACHAAVAEALMQSAWRNASTLAAYHPDDIRPIAGGIRETIEHLERALEGLKP